MQVEGRHTRTIWLAADASSVEVIDQTQLPHAFATARLASLDDAARAIATMVIRGAPLIGAVAAYGLALALREDQIGRASCREMGSDVGAGCADNKKEM